MPHPIQCACGRFLAKPHAIISGGLDPYLKEVRGDCTRCGTDTPALRGDNAWWQSWDAWFEDDVDWMEVEQPE